MSSPKLSTAHSVTSHPTKRAPLASGLHQGINISVRDIQIQAPSATTCVVIVCNTPDQNSGVIVRLNIFNSSTVIFWLIIQYLLTQDTSDQSNKENINHSRTFMEAQTQVRADECVLHMA